MSEMKEVPEGWTYLALKDVCNNITDGSHHSPKSHEDGYPYVTVKDISSGYIDFKKCLKISEKDFLELKKNGCQPQKNDILFSKDGTVGKVALIDFQHDFVVLSSLAILRTNTDIIIPKYLFYILKSSDLLRQALDQKKGVAIRRIILRDINELSFSLAPIHEQHRIVAKIEELFSSLDKGIESLKTAQEELKIYRQAVLKWAFEGKLTKKYLDKSELLQGWKTEKLENLCEFITKGTTPSNNKMNGDESCIPFLKVYNLTFNGTLDFSINPTFISKSTHKVELGRSIVFPGDVLMNIVGPPLGKVSIVPNNYKEWNINQAIVRFRCKSELNNK